MNIANYIDLSVLKPTATRDDVLRACALANKHGLKSVCVAPHYVRLAADNFRNVCAVIGFPHGNTTPDTKLYEATAAMRDGAKEVDMVVNYGAFLDGDHRSLLLELGLIVGTTRTRGVLVKAILETGCYTPDQLRLVVRLCLAAGVDFIKTSTGFGGTGATEFDVAIIRDVVQGRCGIKASGGIRSHSDACRFIELGCTRIGASTIEVLGE